MPSTFRSIRAYEMRPDGVRARVEESADSMKHHSLTEVEEGKRGRAHRRSRIPRFRILSNAQKDARHFSGEGRSSGRRVYRQPAEVAGTETARLLDLDLGALLFERGLDLFGLVLGHAFLDGLGRSVDQILGLLEAEAGQLTDDLDDRDLVRADLGQGRGELGLLLGSGRHLGGSATGGRGGRSGSRGGGGDAVALLEALDELGQLENGHLVDRFEQIVLGQDSHVMSPSTCVLGEWGRLVSEGAMRRVRRWPSGR